MDIDQARAETARAHEDAGEADEDLSYLDAEYIDVLESAPVTDESNVERDEVGPEIKITWWGHSVVFMGGPGTRVYYRKVDPNTWRCSSTLYQDVWRERALVRRCGGNGPWIWKISTNR